MLRNPNAPRDANGARMKGRGLGALLGCILLLKTAGIAHIAWRQHACEESASLTLRRAVRAMTTYYDGNHYVDIARNGYRFARDRYPNYAFFPLFPLMVRVLAGIAGRNDFALGFLILFTNAALSAAGGVLLASVLSKLYGRRVAFGGVIFIFASPTAVFFDMAYSESTLFFLLVAFLWAGERGWVAGRVALGLLAGLARPQGVTVSALAVERPFHLWKDGSAGLACIAGFVLYGAYVAAAGGNAFGVVTVQSNWGRRFDPSGLPGTGHWMDFLFLGLGVGALIVGTRALAWRDWLFLAVSLVVPLCTGSFLSLARFCGVVYPIFVVLAMAGEKFGGRRGLLAVLWALLALRAYMGVAVAAGRFVS